MALALLVSESGAHGSASDGASASASAAGASEIANGRDGASEIANGGGASASASANGGVVARLRARQVSASANGGDAALCRVRSVTASALRGSDSASASDAECASRCAERPRDSKENGRAERDIRPGGLGRRTKCWLLSPRTGEGSHARIRLSTSLLACVRASTRDR